MSQLERCLLIFVGSLGFSFGAFLCIRIMRFGYYDGDFMVFVSHVFAFSTYAVIGIGSGFILMEGIMGR